MALNLIVLIWIVQFKIEKKSSVGHFECNDLVLSMIQLWFTSIYSFLWSDINFHFDENGRWQTVFSIVWTGNGVFKKKHKSVTNKISPVCFSYFVSDFFLLAWQDSPPVWLIKAHYPWHCRHYLNQGEVSYLHERGAKPLLGALLLSGGLYLCQGQNGTQFNSDSIGTFYCPSS